MIEKIIEVKISELLDNDILASDVITSNGKILVVKDTPINDTIIEGLKKNYITSVYVFRKVDEVEEVKNINIRDILLQEAENIINEHLTKNIRKNRNADEIKKIILGILNFNSVFNLALSLRSLGESFFRHSISVALFSIAVGKEMGLPNNRIVILGIAALLQNIGYKMIPQEILHKTGPLTEEEKDEMKKHPLYGFEIIKKMNELPVEVYTIILEHHERYDGTGYPNGISNDKIHQLAKIIGVCDVYDALTNDRPYRTKYKRAETMEYLLGTGDFYFNHEIVEALINTIIIYPYGQWVELNIGEKGIVIETESLRFNARPQIAIYFDKDGNPMSVPKILDLSRRENINIAINRII